MHPVLISVGILVLSGFLAVILPRAGRWSSLSAVAGTWIGCAAGLPPVLATLTGEAPQPMHFAWSVPWGSFAIALDGLSAFFCLPILILSPLGALYGYAYLGDTKRSPGSAWFFYNVLVASMLLLVVARNGVLFLMAWEAMALSSFFLVMFGGEHIRVREAGWTYFVANHIAMAALLALFSLLGLFAGSLEFDRIATADIPPVYGSIIFVLALIGFGTKAGFVPLHVWLPEAHPEAPTHVSALMSGVMIKMGLYGLLLVLTLLGTPPSAWGWALVATGLISGLYGVVFALAQHDIKRLLAYHSVENIGIITIGLGTGMLGLSWNEPSLIVLGFGGGILHVLNHAMFKGLLFLGAGAVLHGTGTREIDRLGGLLKRMPWTGTTFLIGAATISGLPPFNGFVSEFMIYSAGFSGALTGTPHMVLLAALILAGLALIGGLAAACFTKCFGIAFLGMPRSQQAALAHEVPVAMRLPMGILAAGCLGIGLAAPWSFRLTVPAIRSIAGAGSADMTGYALGTMRTMGTVSLLFGVLAGLVVMLFAVRRLLARAGSEQSTGTWDCGYAAPTPRMQYTGSSFAQPLTDLCKTCLGTHASGTCVRRLFPGHASYATHTADIVRERIFTPMFRLFDRAVAPVRMLQNGRIHLYIFYVVVTLVVLLIWKAGFVG